MVPFSVDVNPRGGSSTSEGHDDLSTPQPRPSSHELSVDVQLDYQQLPEEGKQSWGVFQRKCLED